MMAIIAMQPNEESRMQEHAYQQRGEIKDISSTEQETGYQYINIKIHLQHVGRQQGQQLEKKSPAMDKAIAQRNNGGRPEIGRPEQRVINPSRQPGE